MNLPQSRRNFLRASAAFSAATFADGIFVRRVGAAAPFAPPNERIQKARDVALSVLKPGQRDLDYGLKLHAESLVFESYGFAPRAAVDGTKFKAAIESDRKSTRLNSSH